MVESGDKARITEGSFQGAVVVVVGGLPDSTKMLVTSEKGVVTSPGMVEHLFSIELEYLTLELLQ
jgi:hypothetical protein